MKHQKPKISRLGEQAILLEWDFEIVPENLYWLLSVKKILREKVLKSKVELINTYNSLLINYGLSINVIYDDFLLLKQYDFASIKTEALETSTYKLPVCYDAEFGLDLDELAVATKLKIPELIALHTKPIYTVYFIGFLPGFLYLGGMDKRLRISRKKEPRKSVAKGAVGIAENQTGIYPNSSPAGWQIIGNCPVELFNPKFEIPCPFQTGDCIQFYAVDLAAHQRIKTEVEAGSYTLEKANL
ncbi:MULTISPECIES: 5-oxoprolinase subunit PxpB [unclassified Leeuwenhoekiella]|uniref:5-oxoprolinase subunit PxpB n=1 Tax=unclassified Leeuwenhoekiella TaxID=2615029 RepID=UPI000C4ABBA1|nr:MULTISPECIES: 5-oxoprolinase subunit PxpB [unclassified Leeuwenhoekiella]MAW94510.1 allophanate hydrolase [Leeuwenhoekiella sp.]MBA81933.1 allophanate hydrolase [Leeuwenhoekiella sp.]|tara:strand:- start:151 stop:879 length:729 start_codon:yes stop_codon:yes gene_type:complete